MSSEPQTPLKPCPFCGSANIQAVDSLDFVSCQDCGASLEDAEPSSRKLWNTRTAPPARSSDESAGVRAETVEEIAKWLHDETAHPDSYPEHTWPETDRDDGQREGGFVKIVPLHAQANFREIARRLVARFALLQTESKGSPHTRPHHQSPEKDNG
jgi:Lar family restriction alleviation protein